MIENNVLLTCAMAGHVSMAFHQNAVPILQEIAIKNERDRDLDDVVIRLSSEPAVMQSTVIRVERVPVGATHHIRTPDIRLDPTLLRNLSEGVRAEVRVALEAAGNDLAVQTLMLDVLPPSIGGNWRGPGTARRFRTAERSRGRRDPARRCCEAGIGRTRCGDRGLQIWAQGPDVGDRRGNLGLARHARNQVHRAARKLRALRPKGAEPRRHS